VSTLCLAVVLTCLGIAHRPHVGWGDPIRSMSSRRVGSTTRKKQHNTIQICFQNVRGLILESDGDLKLQVLLQFIQQHQVDAFSFVEHNICWDLLPETQQVAKRTRGWWENSHWITSFNKQEHHPIMHQPGGMDIGVPNALSYKALKPGGNDMGLGRWSWVWLRGQSCQVLWLVSAYRPCYSTGPLSMYQQHVQYLASKNRADSPKATFMTDLATAITQWQNDGDLVIVMADMNEDVQTTTIQNMFWSVGLVEAPTTQHTTKEATP